MNGHLVVHALRPVLLVLSGRRLSGHDLHLHRARQEQVLLLLLLHLILVLQRVDTLSRTDRHLGAWRNHLGRSLVITVSTVGLSARRCRLLRRLLVIVLVELVDVQAVAALVHIDVGSLVAHRRLDLNGLRTVALLSVQLSSIHWLDVHDAGAVTTLAMVIRGRHDRLSGWIEAEIGLVHQLVVEA